MGALPPDLRKQLENVVVAARRAAEGASRAAIEGLGVFTERRPEHLDADQASLRNGLRAKMRQLGGKRELLIAECAYEQWHRLLFARFLAENRLLLHPEFQAPVTLADCEELANELGEADGWSVAARYAAEILPGIFHLDGPCVRLRLAPEGRHALEQLLDSLPRDVFLGDDALGWVYQFWQKEKKDEINASERKIGGADLGPVTQLFTENYMVRFLLENSLGAWWAARHPKSPLVKGFRYLRVKDKKPAEALFDSWPRRVAEVTVMDPCCGSGHFLVEAFNMLWRMRAEEEGLSAVEAQDAVLRDNLFGLEIDARCLQIAMFALSLQAWKTSGGWRQLPIPNFACSGIPVKARVEQWRALAYGDPRLEDALVRLYVLFSEAETLGSLIDPRRSAKMSRPSDEQFSLDYIDWEAVGPALERAVISETIDPVSANLDASVAALVRAADYLSRRYVLIATNYPYLKRGSQNERLKDHLLNIWPQSRADLATALFSRWEAVSEGQACMLPQSWLTNTRYRHLRKVLLERQSILGIVRLGAGAFHSISGEVVQPALHIQVSSKPSRHHTFSAMDVASAPSPARKSAALLEQHLTVLRQSDQASNPDCRIVFVELGNTQLLEAHATAWQGIASSDYARFGRELWELPRITDGWRLQQSTVSETQLYGGREHMLYWEDGYGQMSEVCQPGAAFRGREAWGRSGVVVSQMGALPVTLYGGDCFDNNSAVITLNDDELLPALWTYCSSTEFADRVREIDQSLKVTNSTLTKVAFDIEHWTQIARELYPEGLPEPSSEDPTQWLFGGRPELSTAPLHVAVGRLLGYRWPEQAAADDLDELGDDDGIVCFPSVAGEDPAVDRLQRVLATAYGGDWSPSKEKQLLEQSGSKKKNLTDWLKDDFFKQHCTLFGKRPFVWHIWDGQRDGFSALVSYHLLDRKMLALRVFVGLRVAGAGWVIMSRGCRGLRSCVGW